MNRTETEGFYLQDSRSYVGNDMMFWAKGGNGYTTDIDKAQIYTRDEAVKMHTARPSDKPWPVAYINARWRPAVDMQYCKIADALKGTGITLVKPKRYRVRHRCGGCGVFLREIDLYGRCPRCEHDNSP